MSEDQFKVLLLPMEDQLFRMALFMLKSEEEARDQLQEIYLKLWKYRDNLDRVINPHAYVIRVAKNHCLDIANSNKFKQRRHYVRLDIADPIEYHTPLDISEENEILTLITELAHTLPEQQKMIFILRDIEQLSYKEIVDVTGLSIGNIRTLSSISRSKIKKLYIKKTSHGI